jgi:hypothetical protein
VVGLTSAEPAAGAVGAIGGGRGTGAAGRSTGAATPAGSGFAFTIKGTGIGTGTGLGRASEDAPRRFDPPMPSKTPLTLRQHAHACGDESQRNQSRDSEL